MITTIKITPKIKSGITGKTSFRTGVHKTRKDRLLNRNDKYSRREVKSQIVGE